MDITNKFILNFCDRHGQAETIKFIQAQFEDTSSRRDVVRNSLSRLLEQYENLKKSASRPATKIKLDHFLNTKYREPKSSFVGGDHTYTLLDSSAYMNEIRKLQEQNPRADIVEQSLNFLINQNGGCDVKLSQISTKNNTDKEWQSEKEIEQIQEQNGGADAGQSSQMITETPDATVKIELQSEKELGQTQEQNGGSVMVQLSQMSTETQQKVTDEDVLSEMEIGQLQQNDVGSDVPVVQPKQISANLEPQNVTDTDPRSEIGRSQQNGGSEVIQQSEKNEEIKNLMEQVQTQKATLEALNLEIKYYKGRCAINTAELKRMRSRENYYRSKTAKLEEKLKEKKQEEEEQEEEESDDDRPKSPTKEDYRKKFVEMEYRVSLLEDELQDIRDGAVECFDEIKGKYTPEFENCVHRLLDNYVAAKRVIPCMNAVFNFANIKPNRMPSLSTINGMNANRLALAKKSIEEALARASGTAENDT